MVKGNEMDQTFENGRFLIGDCLERMAELPDASADMILCDLPYGTTACSWDSIIPFDRLWAEYWRVARPGAAVVLTAAQPFTTALIGSNMRDFRYCWYWNKAAVTGFANAKKQPLRCVEEVAVFYRKQPLYRPQGLTALGKSRKNSASQGGDTLRQDVASSSGKGALRTAGAEYTQEFTGYPRQVLDFGRDASRLHPTQKPVALFEYLIRTYTDEGMTVLDNCAGSGTTAIAAERSNRRWICIGRDPEYFAKACDRVAREVFGDLA